jgi:uncharacterized protein
MLAEQFIGLAVLGLLVGVFGTMIGAGGGFILTPILLFLYPHDSANTITCISLSVTFANAFSGSAAYARMKRINYRSGILFTAAAIPGAIIGALSTYYVSRKLFTLVFAIALICVAVFLLVRPIAREQASTSTNTSPRFNRTLGVLISVVVGFVSSFLGIGGGIIHVPALANLLDFPVHIATATSHFILASVTLVGIIVHIVSGTFHHGVRRAIALAIGALVGAQIGARLSNRVRGTLIIRFLAVALMLVGIRLIVTAL